MAKKNEEPKNNDFNWDEVNREMNSENDTAPAADAQNSEPENEAPAMDIPKKKIAEAPAPDNQTINGAEILGLKHTKGEPILKNKGNISLKEIKISDISAGINPRKHFNPVSLQELQESIRLNGQKTPILVRPMSDKTYQLIAGERRVLACKNIGKETILAVVEPCEDIDANIGAFIENINREDLTPIEIAKAIDMLIENGVVKNQKEVAKRLGKTETWVTEKMRLLKTPEWIQEAVTEKVISENHAKQIARLDNEGDMKKVYNSINKSGLSVRATEDKVNNVLGAKKKASKNPTKIDTGRPKALVFDELPENISIMVDPLGYAFTIRHTNGDKNGNTITSGMKWLTANLQTLRDKVKLFQSENF